MLSIAYHVVIGDHVRNAGLELTGCPRILRYRQHHQIRISCERHADFNRL